MKFTTRTRLREIKILEWYECNTYKILKNLIVKVDMLMWTGNVSGYDLTSLADGVEVEDEAQRS